MKSLNLKILLIVVGASAVLAILNNIRVPQQNRVSWFGGQPVFAAPAKDQP
ncbi:MAG: hypothetical protein IPK50_21540 [Fibrobacterota bacterium]|nr:MAG: hypothetical protein IPK50_21540 [Fibrobacterota bacterium]